MNKRGLASALRTKPAQRFACCMLACLTLVQLHVARAETLQVSDLPSGLVVCAEPLDDAFMTRLRETKSRVVHVSHTSGNERLPYVDNLVNGLVACGPLSAELRAEIMRVLAPGGVAFILDRESKSVSEKVEKLRRAEIDEWTHFWQGADNNAVAEDTMVGPPRHVQWLAGPKWTRHHDVDKKGNPSIRPLLTAGGRLYYMIDETVSSDISVPGSWFLHARDAFNGILLWKKPVTMQDGILDQVWRTTVVDPQHVYAPLAPGGPLCVIDGATGQTLRTCRGTDGFTEVVKDSDMLYLVCNGAIMSVSPDSATTVWTWRPLEGESIVRLTLAVGDGKVFVRTSRRVCCLAADSGAQRWHSEVAGPSKPMKRFAETHERLIVSGGVALVSHGGRDPNVLARDAPIYKGSHARIHDYGGKLSALSVDDGSVLWTTEYLPNLDDRKPGEIYVIGDTVWTGPDFSRPRDLHSGIVKSERKVLEKLWTDGHHYRCYPGKATSRYIMTAKRGIEFFDLTGQDHSRNNWLRSTCTIGVTPANGLIYNPPHSCGCYVEAQLFGFWALAARRQTPAGRLLTEDRLEKGPAYGQVRNLRLEGLKSSWVTYRGSAERGASCAKSLPTRLGTKWTARLGGKLAAVTAHQGSVFAVSEEAETLFALSMDTGHVVWQFDAGAGMDSPPTYVAAIDSLLLGTRDGYVHCLRASDGALVWRFLAAPERLHTVASGRVESVWPVHGSVLVEDGIAYVCAGRSSYLDGGIYIYGLNAATGKEVHRFVVKSKPVGAQDPPTDAADYKKRISQNWIDYLTFLAADKSDSFSMSGLRSDVMSARNGNVFLRHMVFDRELQPQEVIRPHLTSTSSILDDTQHNRSYWILGMGQFARIPVSSPWILQKKIAVPYGVMLCFDDKTAWCIRQQNRKRGKVSYDLVAVPRPDPGAPENQQPDFEPRTGPGPRELWRVGLPLRPRAMVRAGDAVYVAGLSSVGPELLEVWDNGIKARHRLPAEPVWDGMAVAGGRLLVPLIDGTLRCLGR